MSNAISSWFKWSVMSVALAALAAFVIPVRAQDTTNSAAPHTGFVDDWTHHHVVFSNPGTRDEAVKNGTLEKWTRIVNDPRYKLQQLKRNLGTRPVMTNAHLDSGSGGSWDWNRGPRRDRGPHDQPSGRGVKKDWSAPLGGGESSYTGSGPAASVPGGADFPNGSTLTIEITFFRFDFGLLTLVASNSPTCQPSGGTGYPHYSPPTFCTDNPGNTAQDVADSIAAAFNDTWLGQWLKMSVSSSCTATSSTCGISIAYKYGGGDPIFLSIVAGGGITGFSSGESITTLATVQPNVYPAKYSFSATSATCGDFVVFPTGQAGSSTAANIIAYDNLYGTTGTDGGDGTGCAAGSSTVIVPTAYWAYNTGTGEAVTTSPVLSMTGNKVAFIESNGSTASLVVLTPTATADGATIDAPDTPATGAMVVKAFADGHNDSSSAPYYDYIGDAIYVGDNSGYLHKFTGVFNGTPAEDVTSPWPVKLAGQLSSPVYDSTSGNIWVGNMSGTIYFVASATGTANVGPTYATSIADGPLVDSTAEQVYVFVGDCTECNDPDVDAVFQYPAAGPFVPSYVELGTGGAGYYLYSGTFDNSYFNSESNGSATPTGYLYSIGNTGSGAGGGNLYQVPITAGVLGASSAVQSGLTTSGVSPWPSPITEYYNTSTSTDYIFFSVNAGVELPYSCTTGANNGGCILSYNVTNPSVVSPAGGQSLVNVAGNGCWATGGISVDGSSTAITGTQNIYFVSLDGAEAGNPNAAGTAVVPTSSQCGSNTTTTLSAIQAAQENP